MYTSIRSDGTTVGIVLAMSYPNVTEAVEQEAYTAVAPFSHNATTAQKANNLPIMARHFPNSVNTSGPLPGVCESTHFFLKTDREADLGTLTATYRVCVTDATCRSNNGRNDSSMSTLEWIDKLDAIFTKIGLWDILPHSIFETLSYNCPATSTTSHRGAPSEDAAHQQNLIDVLEAIKQWAHLSFANRATTRKIWRDPTMLARSWKQEVTVNAMHHFEFSRLRSHSDILNDYLTIAATAIKNYYPIRNVRLDRGDQSWMLLTQNEAVTNGLKGMNDRVGKGNIFVNRDAVLNGDPTDFANGGPALGFNGYLINVKMAYYIMASMIVPVMESAKRSGDTYEPLGGNLYRNPSSASMLPILPGSRNEKHVHTLRLVGICTTLIEEHPPIGADNSDGERIYTVNLGTEHADVSGNLTINSNLVQCSHCTALIPPGSDPIRNGSTFMGSPVSIMFSDNVLCHNCAKTTLAYAADTGSYTDSTGSFQMAVFKANGQRTGTNREVRITMSLRHKLVELGKRCHNCDHVIYDTTNLVESFPTSDPVQREFIDALAAGHIPCTSTVGLRLIQSLGAGRTSSSESLLAYGLNKGAAIWDSGAPMEVCLRCTDISKLYTDLSTGKMYSCVDASPSAPEYGYKIPDPSGRFLPRVIGIEFETGPGSSQFRDADAFLNSRCSDAHHIWNIHSDGSLMSGAVEVTTPPVGGLAIPKAVDAMFDMAKAGQFKIENYKAGMHIHTDVTDLFSVMLSVRNSYRNGHAPSAKNYKTFCKMLGEFGDHLAILSRKFVSAYRRSNSYCSGGFGVRSWGCGSDDPMVQYRSALVGEGRTAVCIHCHNGYSLRKTTTYTIENRIWPSSNSKAYTLARCELTQKAIDHFVQASIPCLESGVYETLGRFVANMSVLVDLPVDRFVDGVCDFFSLSSETREGLSALHQRFWWISYYAAEHGLALNSPEIKAMISESLKKVALRPTGFTEIQQQEMAGLMAQKGFTQTGPQFNGAFSDQGSMINMDTTISSHNYHPTVTDQSDLVSAPALSTVTH